MNRFDQRKLILPALAVFGASLMLPATAPDLLAQSSVKVANVPTPRPNPQRNHAVSVPNDPIAALLAGGDDANRQAVEDSDGPVAAYTPVMTKPVGGSSKADLNTVGLRYAVKFLDDGDVAAATAAAYALPNRIDTRVIDWLVATSGRDDVPSSHIYGVWQRLKAWPGQRLLQIRYEQALLRERPSSKRIIEAMAGLSPETEDGLVMLVQAYLDTGNKTEAAKVVRKYWREERFDSNSESRLRKNFGKLLTASDYKVRADRLLYEEQNTAALRNSVFVGKDQEALAVAVVAVSNGKGVESALGKVPSGMRSDPLYTYARIQYLRRADKFDEALKLMLGAPTDRNRIDGDAWWVERRILSREFLDKGDAKTAYRIAAAHSAESSAPIAEAEFHAGWYALEYLKDPNTAQKHFARIHDVSSRPLSQSRADYWLGRAAEKAGRQQEATKYYRRAGNHPSTFYGQLALARLGVKELPIPKELRVDGAAKQRFESNELVQVIRRLDSINRGDRNEIFMRALADQLTDPAEIALLGEMAEEHGGHPFGLQIGKLAAYRGLPVETTAFPTSAIPTNAKIGDIEKPMVYAIARQESAFNPKAVSGAGARGLLQLMPATAKAMARYAGLSYSESKLTADPAYNATLGAEFLGRLYRQYEGSFVMTFAAYNAGPSRVKQWVERYGDPRSPNVDTVNWVERIPFTETRNYVQRVMENMQVYRARLGAPTLYIESDLKRGRV